jgi:transcriptional antiterminator Rof (Rho-off)
MTINEVRVRLGKIVTKVFTESFAEVYEMMSDQLEDADKVAGVISDYLRFADAYIEVMSGEIQSPREKLDKINSFTHPLIIFSVFMRYHLVTQDLISRDQKEKVIMPGDDKGFFRELLITYWESLAR